MRIRQAQKAIKDLLKEMEHPRLGSYIALSEEVGEVADQIMKLEIYEETSEIEELKGEIGDVMVALCELCNVYKIDLEDAFTDKLENLRPRVDEWAKTLVEVLGRKRAKLD